MNDHFNKGKEILKILINNGYEGYFIGDAVRNTIMELPIDQIEINTSATPKAIKGIFDFAKVEELYEGKVGLKYYGYDFNISTFRMESHKDRRSPLQVHYSKNLLDDLMSRDFTINAMAMSHSLKVTDAYEGYQDIRKRKIETIGKAKIRFAEDPIRMIRAIRFVSELNFKLTNKTKSAIKKRRKLLRELDITTAIYEFKKLFSGQYYKKALTLLMILKMYKYIPMLSKAFKKQYYRFKKFTIEEFLLMAFILNEEIDERYLNLVEDKEFFKAVFNLAISNSKSKFDVIELFNNGEEVCLTANRINHYLKKSRKRFKKISVEYQALPIKKITDLEFYEDDILSLINNQDNECIQIICQQILYKVLHNQLANDYDSIKVFVINQIREMKIKTQSDDVNYNYQKTSDKHDNQELDDLNTNLEYNRLVNATNEEEVAESLRMQGQVLRDYTEHRIDMLEKRINEQDRLIREKDRKYDELVKNTRQQQVHDEIDKLVEKNLEMLKEKNYLGNPHKDKLELSKQLHKVYMEYLSDIEDKYRYNEE